MIAGRGQEVDGRFSSFFCPAWFVYWLLPDDDWPAADIHWITGF